MTEQCRAGAVGSMTWESKMISGPIDRTMTIYNSIHNRTSDLNRDARQRLTDYLAALLEFGEFDEDRLEQLGLLYLIDLDEADARPDEPRRFH